MIALVLVAHSPALAAGLAAMLAQAAPSVPVATAAGTDAGVLGTSMPATRRALGAALDGRRGGRRPPGPQQCGPRHRDGDRGAPDVDARPDPGQPGPLRRGRRDRGGHGRGWVPDSTPSWQPASRRASRTSSPATGRPTAARSIGAGAVTGTTETWLRRAAAVVTAESERLTRLDAAIGDGDHGINLSRGFAALVRALDASVGPRPGPSP